DAVHEPLVLQAVGDELGDGDERETMVPGEALQVGAPRHGAVGVQDLTDDAGRIEVREPGEIDAGLRLAHALQHAAGAGPQREDVTGPAQIAGHGGGVDGDADRCRAVGRRDARRDPEPGRRVDADRERGLVRLVVVLGHLRQAERLAALRGQRHADEAASVRRHEVDHRRADLFGRPDQIPFVLAPLVVGDDDELARANVRNRLFYCAERHSCLTYLPSTSASTCTRSPAASFPSVVCARVNGTSDTCTNPDGVISFTVRLTPSSVIEPCRTVVSDTSRGTLRSTSNASSVSATRSTVPTPSTWPCTMWPPSRSAARTARSRFTRRPLAHSPISVRPSVVRTACTVNAPFATVSTVRHAPLIAMLSPFFKPR